MLMLMQQVEKYQLTPYLDSSTINILLFTHTDRKRGEYRHRYIHMGNDHQDNSV